MDWRIEGMCETDIDQVLSLEKISFLKPWGRFEFMTELTSPIAINHVAKNFDSSVIGYSCTQLVVDELSLLKIAVSPSWRCKGIGNLLLYRSFDIAIKRGATKVFLEVRPSNHEAVVFYLNSGFHIVGKRPNYYPETGEDALVMTKRLDV